uniref:TonB-dependent transporter Oar-like beta-barrel domain-containing protein n=1 Tax=Solibacter usitatus (strain Ellin6076) TaxID=234267 RepID=Q028H0_SOLUE
MKKLVAVLLPIACLLALPAFAQDFRATISGHIFDASGGAVPNAKIQVTNIATNEVTNAVSDTSGAYAIPLLRPGDYNLTATAAGFKQFVRDQIPLQAAKVLGLDINLEVGNVTDRVEVTAEAASLETQSASRGGVVTTQQVAEMPLNARNPFMLGAMMSGVQFSGAAIWQRPFDNGAIAQWSINGSRDSSAEFFLDGASNNGQMGSNNIGAVPIVDAVQEFNMMTNMYNAEYGHTGGGIMNVVLKSGTNTHHITAWEFMRRTPLDANTFQNNAIIASATNPTGGAPRPNHYLDQYGWLLDGPLRIPGILKKDGPVKLFYMGTYEGYREGTPNPLTVSYPEAEMRNGDFSKLTNSVGQKITIYNPFDGVIGSDGNVVRQPFPGNIIPKNLLNPVALAVTKYMPLPNQAAAPGSAYSTSNLSIPSFFDKDKFYNLILKFDANIGNKNRAYFRHLSNDRTEDRAVNGIDNKPGTDGQQPFQRINDAYVADWTTTVSPTLLFDVRASYNRFIEKGFGRANDGFDLTSLGLQPSLLGQLPSPQYFGLWQFTGTLYQNLGRYQSNNWSNTYQLQGNVTKVAGSHTIKAGIDTRQINYLQENTGNILQFQGDTTWTQRSNINGDSTQGDPYATFLLGIVSGSSNYPVYPWWRQPYTALFVNDDWKVSRKLTLNLGLRYDITPFAHEKHNRQNGAFDPNAKSGIVVPADALAALKANGVPDSQINNLANLKGSITFAGVNGVANTPATLKKKNFGPRFGFAYQLGEKLVMRGGFALYFSDPNNDIFQTAGYSTSTSIVNSLDGGRTPITNILSNPYPNGISLPTGSSAGTLTFAGKNNNWFDTGAVIPKTWSFSYGFQYQATRSSTLEASYVGSRSYDQTMQKDYNIPSLDFRKTCNIYDGGSPIYCNQTVPNPFKGLPAFIGTSYYTSTTISRFNLARPFPQFNGNMTQQGRNDSAIRYDSLQINYNIRFRGGLTLLGNYTLSKQIEQWGFNDAYNNVYQQGLYTVDRPQVLKLTAVYSLPFGQGKHFLSGAHGFVNKLVSGWEWNSNFQDAFRGAPATLPQNAILLKDPLTPVKDASGNLAVDAQGRPIWDGHTDWKAYQVRGFNPCVLKQNDDGTVVPQPSSIALGCGAASSGNYAWLATTTYAPSYNPFRSGQIRRQHAFSLDTSLLKMTQVNERIRFQLGFEAFNVANHNFYGLVSNYDTSPSSTTFGVVRPSTVSTQNGLPRQIQVRMKFFW